MNKFYINSEEETDDLVYDYVAYTDGGYSRKHNIGAYAFVLLDGEEKDLIKRGAWKIERSTNNRAELRAICAAIYNLPADAKNVCVCSDSQYALKTLVGMWSGPANEDIQKWFSDYAKTKDITVVFKWVRGHSGDKWNEVCDEMCNTAAGVDLNAEYEKYRGRK